MNRLVINADLGEARISRHIYGHFAEHLGRCIYEGLWVGEDSPIPNTRGIRNDVVEALRRINVPNVRWPGGLFAEYYHWRDGIGPHDQRRPVVCRKIEDSNHFGLHEFMDLCDMLECEPYLCGNVGMGSVQEMQDWVEYMTYDGTTEMADLRRSNGRKEPWPLKYWGIGNENWIYMRPEYYADVYRQYAAYVEGYGKESLYRVACGPGGPSYDWTEVLMREAGKEMEGLSLHHYTVPGPWANKGSAVDFTGQEWMITMQKTLEIEGFVEGHSTKSGLIG